jgi:hypothetical protein
MSVAHLSKDLVPFVSFGFGSFLNFLVSLVHIEFLFGIALFERAWIVLGRLEFRCVTIVVQISFLGEKWFVVLLNDINE